VTTLKDRGMGHTPNASNRALQVLRGFALLACFAFAGTAAAAVMFITTGNMTAPRTLHTATLLSNGQVLITGGSAGSTYLASAELYDSSTGMFAATGSMGESRAYHTATRLADGKVLIAGGFNTTNWSLAGAELYDPATGTFVPTGSMATPRYSHTATRLADGRVLISGGFSFKMGGAATTLDSAEIYDPSTGTFTPTGSMSAKRQQHMAALLPDGRVLVAGGFDTASLISAEVFDPATGGFSPTGDMNESRYVATSTVLGNGQVLVVGGLDGGIFRSSAELYDPASGTFAYTGGLMEARNRQTAALLNDGQVLVAGGRGAAGNLYSAELYDPATGQFSQAASMTEARYGHTATQLANGRILVAGGSTAPSAEVYATPLPPIADAGSDQSIYLGQTATLSGAGSSDPGGAPLTYTWTIDARPAGSAAALSSTTTETTTLHPDAVGQYVISLVVNNGIEDSPADTVLVDVAENLAPTAGASAQPVSGDAPLDVLFDGSASLDPERAPLSYAWDFGDGTPADMSASASHTYTVPGKYTAVLTVTDDLGNTDQASVDVNVTAPNTPPTIGPTASPSSGFAPLNVQFVANARDPEGGELEYAWDFGDGSPGSTKANPKHAYTRSGVYKANVTVTDGVFLVNGAVTVSINSALSAKVTHATVKFGKRGKVRGEVEMEAKFVYPGTPNGVIKVEFDGVTLLDVPFSSFKRKHRGEYEYHVRNIYAKLDLKRGTLQVSRHRMLLDGVDDSNGTDVVISFGASVATDHFVMREYKHHGERVLYYRGKEGKKHHHHGRHERHERDRH